MKQMLLIYSLFEVTFNILFFKVFSQKEKRKVTTYLLYICLTRKTCNHCLGPRFNSIVKISRCFIASLSLALTAVSAAFSLGGIVHSVSVAEGQGEESRQK